MDDRHPIIREEFRERMLRLSGETRVMMGTRMFEAARQMAMASMPEGLSDSELKAFLFLRLYSHDFDDEKRNEIAAFFKGDVGIRR